FTGLVHRLNIMLVLAGRVEDTNHVKLIDIYGCLGTRVTNRLTENAANEASVVESSKRTCTGCADRDAVIDVCSQTRASLITDGHVTATVHVESERIITYRCVTRARSGVFHG